MRRHRIVAAVPYTIALLGLTLVAGCTSRTEPFVTPDPGVRIELEGNNQRRLLSFYVGGMVTDMGADPFEAEWVIDRDDSYFLVLEKIPAERDVLRDALERAANDQLIDWAEFSAIVESEYYAYRKLPRTLEDLRSREGAWASNDEWFNVDVNGVMSPSRRRIYVKRNVIITALRTYLLNGERLVYEEGTTFISEHVEGGGIIEVSVMTKRADQHWDFYAYDATGELATLLRREPTDLTVPTKCVGCHFGNRLFEPERSFPAEARPAPDGPRKLYVNGRSKRGDVVASLDEHRKRSDTVLGLYGTLMLTNILADLDSNVLIDEDLQQLISNLGF